YRKQALGKSRGRQDVVALAEQSLLDLVAHAPSAEGTIHYDAIAFLPTRVRRRRAEPKSAAGRAAGFSPVDSRLDFRQFVNRLVDVASFRGLV
ncbi:MAG TPA: hypothetical protein VFW87_09355, partial [Pirellulales bacterium]|nr:hypothetical protein [Pirellulales bacterium]